MGWIEKLFSPETRGVLETIAAVIEIAAVILSAGLFISKLLFNGQTGIPLIDKYLARRSLRQMAIVNAKIRRFSKDTPFLVTQATEVVFWAILFTGDSVIVRLLGFPIISIDTYIRIFQSPKANSSVILHIILGILCAWMFANRVEPFAMIAYPRAAERRGRQAKGLFERARLSAEEQEELTTRIGLKG
jgi:hypothetical protein